MMIMLKRLIIPALLLVSVVALTACSGSKLDPIADATKVAEVPPKTSFDLIAEKNKFNETILVAQANTEVKISLSNQDNVIHNFALYTDSDAKENLFRGEVFQGKKIVDDSFTSPAPGIYFFRCDAHSEMKGTFVTR